MSIFKDVDSALKELVFKELDYWKNKYPSIVNIIKNGFDQFVSLEYKNIVDFDKPPYENITLIEHMKREEDRVAKLDLTSQ